MAKKRAGRSAPSRSNRGSTGKLVLAFLLGIGIAAGAAYLHLRSTPQRQVVSAPSAPVSAPIAHARPAVPAPAPPRTAPFGTSEDVFEAGARQYSAHCANCHGTPANDTASTPQAQQFWREGRDTTASQAPGELYSEISTGAPGKAMPSYAHTLTDTQIWDLALLLKNADQDLPDPVLKLLNAPPKR